MVESSRSRGGDLSTALLIRVGDTGLKLYEGPNGSTVPYRLVCLQRVDQIEIGDQTIYEYPFDTKESPRINSCSSSAAHICDLVR